MQAIEKFLDARMELIRKSINAVIITIFAVQVVLIFSQVVWRFVFNNPFPWSEELARHLQVWLILLTSSVCIRKGRHLAVDYATHALPFGINKILKLIIMVFIMFFTIILIIFGIKMILITIHQITPATRVPILFVYSAFPLTGFFMFMEALIVFLRLTGVKNEVDMETLYSK